MTDVELDDGQTLDLEQQIVALAIRRNLDDRWFVGGSVGVVAGGSLRGDAGSYDLGPGFVLAFDVGREWLGGGGANLFLTTTLTAAVAVVPTYQVNGGAASSLVATDLRLDATFGITLWNLFSPYLSARAFGGPFFWELDGDAKTGSDPDHHTLAIGSTVSVARGIDFGVDFGFHGARGVSLSAGVSF